MAVWRPSRQARSFEGSGHLGPDDRARVQLESARLGVPATRRASAFRCVTRPKTPPTAGRGSSSRSVGQGGVSHYALRNVSQRGKPEIAIRGSKRPRVLLDALAGGWRHLALSCSVHGQDGPLPRRATVSPAPLPPHATRSESKLVDGASGRLHDVRNCSAARAPAAVAARLVGQPVA